MTKWSQMDKGDKEFTIGFFTAVALILLVFGVAVFEYSHAWSEQGTISWVGQKTFTDTGSERFVLPFAVTVPVHGTFNFTAIDLYNDPHFCGDANSQMMGNIALHAKVGLVKLNCGGFDLVIDP